MTKEELKQAYEEEVALREKLTRILHDTANALHGGPLENGLWSFHDLADLATAHREALAAVAWHAIVKDEDNKDVCEACLSHGEDNCPVMAVAGLIDYPFGDEPINPKLIVEKALGAE